MYFVDILILSEVKNVFTYTKNLRQKFKKRGSVLIFYAFEDSTALIVFIIGRK